MEEFKILTIIVTYNGSQWVDTCFSSLENSSVEVDTIVIDNGSTDNTVTVIRNNFPAVEILEPGENLGFGKANNIGLERVLEMGYDFAFLLNQDAWVEPDTIEKLVSVSIDNPDFGIVSPLHMNGEGNLLDYKFHEYINRPDGEGRKLSSDLLLHRTLSQIYKVAFVNAAAWLLPKACIEKVGLFDDVLFKHYGEDINYTNRVLYHAFKIGIAPKALIYHDREPRKGQFTASPIKQDHKKRRFRIKYSNVLISNVDHSMRELLKVKKKVLKSKLKRLKFSDYREIKKEIEELKAEIILIQSRRQRYIQPFKK